MLIQFGHPFTSPQSPYLLSFHMFSSSWKSIAQQRCKERDEAIDKFNKQHPADATSTSDALYLSATGVSNLFFFQTVLSWETNHLNCSCLTLWYSCGNSKANTSKRMDGDCCCFRVYPSGDYSTKADQLLDRRWVFRWNYLDKMGRLYASEEKPDM